MLRVALGSVLSCFSISGGCQGRARAWQAACSTAAWQPAAAFSCHQANGGRFVRQGPSSPPGHWTCLVVMLLLLMLHIVICGYQ